MKHRYIILTAMLLSRVLVFAQAPEGYYATIDGLSGRNLKFALQQIIASHTVFDYGDLWETYEVTDVVPGTKDQILEYYSDKVMYYSSRGTQINREHTVPQSWWGKGDQCEAYTDLFNVLPAEATANGAKSNNPLGVVKSASFTNGVTKVGTPTAEMEGAGGANRVFEPADQYKGDFARIYLYVATCYSSVLWTEQGAFGMLTGDMTLQDWIIPVLLKWNADDPVDEREMRRQEACYYLQGNRNPFVDYPQLADYIWREADGVFDLKNEKINEPSESYTFIYKAARPTFSVQYGATEETAQGVEENTTVKVSAGNSNATLYYNINDQEKWDSVACNPNSNYYNASKSIKIYLRDRVTKIQAFTRKEGRADSDTLVAYYCVTDNSEYLLYEDFVTAGSGDNISTSNQKSSFAGSASFPKDGLSKVYQAGGAVKLGTGSVNGSMTSKPIDFEGGTLKVSLDVKGWTSVENKIQVDVSGAESQLITYSAKNMDPFEHAELVFEGVEANPTVTISTTAKRAFIDNVIVTAVENDVPLIAGDIDGDGELTISDITTMIDVYLMAEHDDIDMTLYDIDGDETFAISDITAIIDLYLNKGME